MERHGTTWNGMELHGTTWNDMERHGTTWNDAAAWATHAASGAYKCELGRRCFHISRPHEAVVGRVAGRCGAVAVFAYVIRK